MTTSTAPVVPNLPHKVRYEWLSPWEFARRYKRPRPTVYRWIYNGTLCAFGFCLLLDQRGHWWILDKTAVN